jgi:putative endonuclease
VGIIRASVIARYEAIQPLLIFPMKPGYIYIMASERNGTIYTGVTSSLLRRIEEHKSGIVEGFSKKYNCKFCVYYEYFEDINLAIVREKQLKWWNRKQKLKLIESINPEWNDLTEQIKERI